VPFADATPIDLALTRVFSLIVPEAVLIGMACLLFILSTFRVSKCWAGWLSLIAIGAAAVLHFVLPTPTDLHLTAETMKPQPLPSLSVAPALLDGMATFVRLAALVLGVLLVCICWREAGEERGADYFGCLLVIIAGFALVGKANDLIFLWLALELISIPTYVLLYLPKKDDPVGQEAAMKYFLLSVVSSGLLLFGFSYLYGITGTTNIFAILKLFETKVAGDMSTMAVIASVMVLAGLGFRITAFPFHFYAPDVYQGGPTGVVAMLAVVPKIAGFAALIRLMTTIALTPDQAPKFAPSLLMVLWVISAITMTAGNILALWQDNLRRLLAYSSVAHSGYMLIGIAIIPAMDRDSADFPTVTVDGASAILFYLVAYSAMTLGVFGVIAYLNSKEESVVGVDDLAGLQETHPYLAATMTLFLFSLIGIPLTAGFFGKFYLIFGALSTTPPKEMGSWYQVLVLVALLNAGIAAYYYLRIVGVMYTRSSFRPAEKLGYSTILIAIAVCAAVTLFFGLYPSPLLSAARTSLAMVP
jgi:NADH-quinone oxidoreductase subunit N